MCSVVVITLARNYTSHTLKHSNDRMGKKVCSELGISLDTQKSSRRV
jgi:hypothetical protein